MNNFLQAHILQTIVRDYENKTSITATTKYLKQLGADETGSKHEFISEYFVPAMQQLASGYNSEVTVHAAKVLVKIGH